jgi:hypothetical protein
MKRLSTIISSDWLYVRHCFLAITAQIAGSWSNAIRRIRARFIVLCVLYSLTVETGCSKRSQTVRTMTSSTQLLFVDNNSHRLSDSADYSQDFQQRLREAGYAGKFDHHDASLSPSRANGVMTTDRGRAQMLAAHISRQLAASPDARLSIIARSFDILTALEAILLLPSDLQVQHVFLFDPIPISSDLMRDVSSHVTGRIYPLRTNFSPEFRITYGSPGSESTYGDSVLNWKFVRDSIAPLVLKGTD